MKAPFPYYGGKSSVAKYVWQRLGNPPNYIEPFFGSGAVLLGRTDQPKTETVNDIDGMICNFWRSVLKDPETVANITAWPLIESDLHAWNCKCLEKLDEFTPKLEGDPYFYDAEIAGWWLWGKCMSLGNSWCNRVGPWWPIDGKLCKSEPQSGVKRSKLSLDGIRGAVGVWRSKPHFGSLQGILRHQSDAVELMNSLCRRLARVEVLCGDWSRAVTPSLIRRGSPCGVFFDAPYSVGDQRVYRNSGKTIQQEVAEWCLEHGSSPCLRIAVCGEDGEHEALEDAGWDKFAWSRSGGASRGGDRSEERHSERILFSPHCLADQGYEELSLFGGVA